MKHPIVIHLQTTRSLWHQPRRPAYNGYLNTPSARTECRSYGARLAVAGSVQRHSKVPTERE